MKKYHQLYSSRQSGFVHLDVLIVLVLVAALVGFVGYRALDNRQSQTKVDTSNEAIDRNLQQAQGSIEASSQSGTKVETAEPTPNIPQ